jgi:lysophospholipid acyltransferase (LPLAT)-like uncharacterized protein
MIRHRNAQQKFYLVMLSIILPPGLTALVRSLRYTWIGEPLPEKCVVAFWHSRMIAGWWMSRKNAVALVSQSKDGEHLNKILREWKYKTVRGSSAHSGKEALDDAIKIIQNEDANRIVITPDGPQGPKEIFKRGAFIAAQELDLPLYFLSIEYKGRIRLLKSWDKFQVPFPFSSIVINSRRLDTTSFPSDPQSQKLFLEEASHQFQTPIEKR